VLWYSVGKETKRTRVTVIPMHWTRYIGRQ